MTSISIATLGMYAQGIGGGGISVPPGQGVPVDFRREEHAVRPLITVKNVTFEERLHEITMSVKLIE